MQKVSLEGDTLQCHAARRSTPLPFACTASGLGAGCVFASTPFICRGAAGPAAVLACPAAAVKGAELGRGQGAAADGECPIGVGPTGPAACTACPCGGVAWSRGDGMKPAGVVIHPNVGSKASYHLLQRPSRHLMPFRWSVKAHQASERITASLHISETPS